jgi:hypothetical protein
MSMVTAMSPQHNAPSSWTRITATTLALIGAIMILLVAFALPGINSGFHHVPVAVVAPAKQAAALSARLEQAVPGGFDVRLLSSAEQARQQILDREVYGALLVDEAGLSLDIASAASPTMATALTQAMTALGKAMSLPVQVQDVRPFLAEDPKGIGLSAGALPLALGGWIAAVGIMAVVRGARQQLITATGFAIFGGLGMTAILQFGFGTIDGSYWLTSVGAMLGAGAACVAVLGLQRMFGAAGLGLAVVALILLGGPLSGLTSAPEMLPAPWGAIGQLLPPGATGTLLRNLALFDGAATTRPVLVLSGWLIAGLALFAAGTLRNHRPDPRPAMDAVTAQSL